MHRSCKGALVEHRPVELVELGAGLAFDIGAPEVDDFDARRSAASIPSTVRAPASPPRLRAAPRRGRGPGRRGSCDTGRRASRSDSRRRLPSASTRSPRPAPARPRRTARAPPGFAGRGGDGSRRCGRRAAAPWNRRARAGSRSHADWACAAAPAGAPCAVRADDQRGLVGGEQNFQLGAPGHRARARGERPLERLVGRLGLGAGLAVADRFDVDGRHSRVLSESSKSGRAVRP